MKTAELKYLMLHRLAPGQVRHPGRARTQPAQAGCAGPARTRSVCTGSGRTVSGTGSALAQAPQGCLPARWPQRWTHWLRRWSQALQPGWLVSGPLELGGEQEVPRQGCAAATGPARSAGVGGGVADRAARQQQLHGGALLRSRAGAAWQPRLRWPQARCRVQGSSPADCRCAAAASCGVHHLPVRCAACAAAAAERAELSCGRTSTVMYRGARTSSASGSELKRMATTYLLSLPS